MVSTTGFATDDFDGWTWTNLDTYLMDASDGGHIPVTIDLSAWTGGSVKIGFFGDGDFGGYFYVDDVQVAMSFNSGPTFDSPLPGRSDVEGVFVNFQVEASAPAGAALAFSAAGLPPGISGD